MEAYLLSIDKDRTAWIYLTLVTHFIVFDIYVLNTRTRRYTLCHISKNILDKTSLIDHRLLQAAQEVPRSFNNYAEHTDSNQSKRVIEKV
jgi:hypothetical protein